MPDARVRYRVAGIPKAGQFGPDVYADWRLSSLGEITEGLEHRLIFDLAGPLQSRSVLDVGCGDGTLVFALALEGAAHVTGCDPDARMVSRARAGAAQGTNTVDFAVARSESLPFADNSFDIVVCVAVLTFVPNGAIAIQEMARVLRPGGRLVIGDLGKWSLWAARRRIRGWFGAKLWRSARFRTIAELAALVRVAGLTIGATKGAIFYPPWTVIARLMAPFDPVLTRLTAKGAAFVALQATKA